MPTQLFRSDALESLLLANWTKLIDSSSLMRRVLIDARDAKMKHIVERDARLAQTSVTITKFNLTSKGLFEFWAEFTVPVADGVAVGTHIYAISPTGDCELVQTSGVIFVAQKLKLPPSS